MRPKLRVIYTPPPPARDPARAALGRTLDQLAAQLEAFRARVDERVDILERMHGTTSLFHAGLVTLFEAQTFADRKVIEDNIEPGKRGGYWQVILLDRMHDRFTAGEITEETYDTALEMFNSTEPP